MHAGNIVVRLNETVTRANLALITYLYVTSGIGTSGLPLRWGVPPEIVVLDTAGKQRT